MQRCMESLSMASNTGWDEYHGTLAIPGEQESHSASILLDREGKAVTLRLDAPIGGSAEWTGERVQVAERLKYTEVVFATTGLPREPVELTWKLNAGHVDGTIAGVIIARPNELRISGEKGFTMVRSKG